MLSSPKRLKRTFGTTFRFLFYRNLNFFPLSLLTIFSKEVSQVLKSITCTLADALEFHVFALMRLDKHGHCFAGMSLCFFPI